jgi:hypothetical protein
MKKRVAVIITEYWDISHADVIITKMMEGFVMDGRKYTSTIVIVAMYVDQFPPHDISRELTSKHCIPLYNSIRKTLLNGKDTFDMDGIIIIGEHGDYPLNEYNQQLYPRRKFFEECLNVMLEFDRIVPVFSDKGFAIVQEDIEWMYKQIKKHQIPFMSSSSVPFVKRLPFHEPFANGAPLCKMFGFAYGSLERYTYHTLEMMQSIAENRACGESGIRSVQALQGREAVEHIFTEKWATIYRKLAGYLNVSDIEKFPRTLQEPVLFQFDYVDGLQSGILFVDSLVKNPEIQTFASAYQVKPDEEAICLEFPLQNQKPYAHAGRFVLEVEKFIHTKRTSFPVERSLLTTGALDACMRSLHYGQTIATPYLEVVY